MNVLLTVFAYFVLFLTIFFLFVYWFFMIILYGYWKRRGIETIKPNFLFGNMKSTMLGEMSMNTWCKDIYDKAKGPYAGFYLFHKPALIIKDPELLKLILIKDFNTFPDRGMYCDEKQEPLSGHLFRLSGERWRYMRSKLSPSFTLGKLKMMFGTMLDTAKQLENYLETVAEKGEPVIIKDDTLRYSADIIASVIFGIEVNSFKDRYNKWWKIVTTLVYEPSLIRIIVFKLVMFAPGILQVFKIPSLFHSSNQDIFELVKEVVDYREENKVTRNDFMQLLIQLKNKGEVNTSDNVKNTNVYDNDPSSEGLSIYEISAQAYTMFFAGFETSATTISWALYLLAKHPDVQKKVHEEIDKCLSKYGGELTYDCLQEMIYLECVICESLRLYPVLGFSSRIATKDYTIPGSNHVIKKGILVYTSILGLHLDPANFPKPDVFDPDRFLPENKHNIRPYTYMPFGEGPRNCIGKRFGQLQTGIALVMTLRKHSVSLTKKSEGKIKMCPKAFSYIPLVPIAFNVTKRTK